MEFIMNKYLTTVLTRTDSGWSHAMTEQRFIPDILSAGGRVIKQSVLENAFNEYFYEGVSESQMDEMCTMFEHKIQKGLDDTMETLIHNALRITFESTDVNWPDIDADDFIDYSVDISMSGLSDAIKDNTDLPDLSYILVSSASRTLVYEVQDNDNGTIIGKVILTWLGEVK